MPRILPAILVLLALCGGAVFFFYQSPTDVNPLGEVTQVSAAVGGATAGESAEAEGIQAADRVEAPAGMTRSNMNPEGGAVRLAASTEEASWVRAKLVDSNGRAIAGSYLRAQTSQRFGKAEIMGEGASDSSGSVRMQVPSDVALELVSSGDFWAPQSYQLAALQPGEELDLGSLTLATADTIAGRVLDPEGNPLALSRIHLSESGSSIMMGSQVNHEVTTDENGAYEIGGIPAGTYRLRAFSDGFAPAQADPVVVNGRGVTQALDLHMGAGRSVSGVVLDEDHRPVVGAVVGPNRMLFDIGFTEMSESVPLQSRIGAHTDSQGRFTLAGLESELDSVVIRGEGFATQRKKLPAAGEELVVHLTRSLTFAGKVVGPNGKPVAGAEVRLARSLEAQLGDVGGMRRGSEQVTAQDGSFSIQGLRPGDYTLQVFSPLGQLVDFPVALTENVSGLAVTLEPARHLVVSVLGSDGNAVAGADVSLHDIRSEGSWGDFEVEFAHDASSDGDTESETRMTSIGRGFRGTSDAFGRAVIYGVPVGTYEIEVHAKGHADRTHRFDRVDDAQVEEVMLPAASQLVVFVMTPDKVALPRVDVYLKPLDREGETLSQISDTTGRAVWPRLESGRYEVGYREAEAEMGGMVIMLGGPLQEGTMHPVEQVDVRGDARVEVVMKIHDLGLASVLVTRNGSPAGGVQAWLENPPNGLGPQGMDLSTPKGSTTNASGRALLEPKEPGKYILVVRAGNQAPQVRKEVELAGGSQEFEIEIPGAMVKGNLFADSRPMVGASLSLERDSGGEEGATRTQGIAIMVVDNGEGPAVQMASGSPNDASAVSDADGDFRFTDVPAGTWVVKCRARGYERWTSEPFKVGEGDDVDLGTHRLQKGASISGADATYDPELTGRSMFGPNALIMLQDEDGGMVDIAMTGSDGRYSFNDLAPGTYTVNHGDYTSKALVITAGEQLNHDLPKK
ncbi:MAG: carboxypeptidase-like regulatory domain-containing protein [Planctomycetota bacterium]